jgi:Enoyl-[acyl-carrier-protein] reductase [NADH] (EC 1.3.1.9)
MSMQALSGKKGLVIGIANADSIAWACARACADAGAVIGGTWQLARPHPDPRGIGPGRFRRVGR